MNFVYSLSIVNLQLLQTHTSVCEVSIAIWLILKQHKVSLSCSAMTAYEAQRKFPASLGRLPAYILFI